MQDGQNTLLIVLFVLVAFPIFFSTLWVGITLLMSFIGGWGRVGKSFAAAGRPSGGRVFRHVTGMFGVASYKHVLTVITTDDGIYLENRAIFRPGHPPLFIPFSAIVGPRRHPLLFWEYVAFEVGNPPLASVRLPSKVFDGAPVVVAK